ncbi:hypothetical protein JST97_33695 [bacterium]|nr:hypothetical protein [bacterium]
MTGLNPGRQRASQGLIHILFEHLQSDDLHVGVSHQALHRAHLLFAHRAGTQFFFLVELAL